MGYNIEQATRKAFPRARNHNSLLKRLLNSDKLMQVVHEHSEATFQQILNKKGITSGFIAEKLADILQNPEAKSVDKRWAIDIVIKILEAE